MSVDTQNSKAQTIHPASLTSLRFFAVMFIALHHLRLSFQPDILTNPRFVNFGVIGVTFFLFLSGFVIRLSYDTFSTTKESLHFLQNRAVRIYPVHICTFIFSIFIVVLWYQPIQTSTAIINILLLQSYFPSELTYFSFNAVSWMLSTLFFFYVIFAFANHKPRNLLWLFCLPISTLIVSMNYIESHSNANALWLLYIFPPNRLLVCLCGVAASLFFLKYHTSLQRSIGSILATLLESIALLSIVDFICWSYLTRFLRQALLLINFPFAKSLDLLNVNYLASAIPVFLVLITFALEKGFFSTILTKPFFVFLGELGFSMFMFHQLFFRLLELNKQSILACLGEISTIAVLMISIIPLSFLIYKYIENPIRKKLRVRF